MVESPPPPNGIFSRTLVLFIFFWFKINLKNILTQEKSQLFFNNKKFLYEIKEFFWLNQIWVTFNPQTGP